MSFQFLFFFILWSIFFLPNKLAHAECSSLWSPKVFYPNISNTYSTITIFSPHINSIHLFSLQWDFLYQTYPHAHKCLIVSIWHINFYQCHLKSKLSFATTRQNSHNRLKRSENPCPQFTFPLRKYSLFPEHWIYSALWWRISRPKAGNQFLCGGFVCLLSFPQRTITIYFTYLTSENNISGYTMGIHLGSTLFVLFVSQLWKVKLKKNRLFQYDLSLSISHPSFNQPRRQCWSLLWKSEINLKQSVWVWIYFAKGSANSTACIILSCIHDRSMHAIQRGIVSLDYVSICHDHSIKSVCKRYFIAQHVVYLKDHAEKE